MDATELNEILENHRLWLQDHTTGKRADLYLANLQEVCLSGIDLRYANLDGANLRRAKLLRADLSGASLYMADLQRANLQGANLFRADLSRTDLSEAVLYSANCCEANLFRANLSRADVSMADFSGADLSGAHLSLVKSYGTNFNGANLHHAVRPDKGFTVLQLPLWTVYVYRDSVCIGCQYHTHESWREFTDDQIAQMSPYALEWWNTHKALIFAAMDREAALADG